VLVINPDSQGRVTLGGVLMAAVDIFLDPFWQIDLI
jgi:predicted ATP-binding protein involved in virulence